MDSIGTSDGLLEPRVGASGPRRDAPRARLLGIDQRIALAVRSLRGDQSVTGLASEHGVSRQYVHEQKRRAQDAISEAFEAEALLPGVIGHLPVTKPWLRRVIVSAALNTHGSVRGIREHVQAITGLSISEGTVFNALREAVSKAEAINDAEDLRPIREGAHDEIFSQGVPVLVGVEPRSDYLYLLEPSNNRDEASWWAALTEKHERQA